MVPNGIGKDVEEALVVCFYGIISAFAGMD
jgi:hypothetical protein